MFCDPDYIFYVKIIFLDKKFPFSHLGLLTLVNVCEVFVVGSYGGFGVPHMILVLLKCIYDSIAFFLLIMDQLAWLSE